YACPTVRQSARSSADRLGWLFSGACLRFFCGVETDKPRHQNGDVHNPANRLKDCQRSRLRCDWNHIAITDGSQSHEAEEHAIRPIDLVVGMPSRIDRQSSRLERFE